MSNLWGAISPSTKSSTKKAQNHVEAAKQAGELPVSQTSQQQEEVKELQKRFRKEVFFVQKVQQQELEIYSRQRRETEEEIRILQEEVAALAKTAKNLDRQLDLASEKLITEPSVYDVSFLRKLKILVLQFLENVEDASLWLEEFNQKGKKKGSFWGTFSSKKGGAQFLYSDESYTARSVG
ncbi:MAG: DUF5660 family protein [Patescibacteria group bacterium]|nr:hypothetical protein [Patescibacteria group bacterium]